MGCANVKEVPAITQDGASPFLWRVFFRADGADVPAVNGKDTSRRLHIEQNKGGRFAPSAQMSGPGDVAAAVRESGDNVANDECTSFDSPYWPIIVPNGSE